METNPRPLRTKQRMLQNNPRATIYKGWTATFNELDKAMKTLNQKS